jgi:hypothetical protein
MVDQGIRVKFLAGTGDFSLLHNDKTGSMRSCFSGLKWQGREADHSPSSADEIMNGKPTSPLSL